MSGLKTGKNHAVDETLNKRIIYLSIKTCNSQRSCLSIKYFSILSCDFHLPNMSHKKKQMTMDEEFRVFTGVVLNNWFALKVVINECNEYVSPMNTNINGLLDLLISSTRDIISRLSNYTEAAEAIENYFDSKFNTYIEDDSCEEVLFELVHYFNLLSCNKREALSQAFRHLTDKRNILTREEYDPSNVLRVDTPTTSPRDITESIPVETPCATWVSRNVNESMEEEANEPGIALPPFDQPRDEWVTVKTRRRK